MRFTYQRFSQRYADVNWLDAGIPIPELRRQDEKNRQNSIDDVDPEKTKFLKQRIEAYFNEGMDLYNELIRDESQRSVRVLCIPLAVPTRLYMTGSIRSWIHYIELRSANGTQKEHMDIANDAKRVFTEQFPSISEALELVINIYVVN